MELVEVDNGGSEELNFILGAPHGGGGGWASAGGRPTCQLAPHPLLVMAGAAYVHSVPSRSGTFFFVACMARMAPDLPHMLLTPPPPPPGCACHSAVAVQVRPTSSKLLVRLYPFAPDVLSLPSTRQCCSARAHLAEACNRRTLCLSAGCALLHTPPRWAHLLRTVFPATAE